MEEALSSRFSLSEEEINTIRRHLKRPPNDLELAMFDAEWSEHCSYKSSKPLLKQLPTKGEGVLVGPGFDAGVIDVGGGYVVTVHIESHNHPSAVDPYGGAATGVGGILRDILAMGTRPVALLNALRFGDVEKSSHSQWLFRHVVRGISDYGNCVGVPTVGGEVQFDSCFERNCLVDVVCIGLGKKEDLVFAEAKHPGDLVVVVGGKTGRDGILGASFASQTLGADLEQDRSAVQIPDPFTKKQIIEATLEAIRTGRVRGLKDLGGGGLTCGLSETADKGGSGILMNVSRVPVREEGMSPVEVMLSESQERMLFFVERGFEGEVFKVFDKYDLTYSVIGEVDSSRELVVKEGEAELARLPVSFLANAPPINWGAKKPEYIDRAKEVPRPPQPEDMGNILLGLVSSPSIASKRWVYEQYDHEVGLLTVVKPGYSGASVLRLPNGRFLALRVDGNSKHCYLDPYNGSAGILSEACRNILAVGGKPMAMVDHLQFGDPSDSEVFWAFSESVRGLADYCKSLDLPCVGGKVSFYNEVESKAIKPSPVVAVLGVMDRLSDVKSHVAREDSEIIVAVGLTKNEMGGSEYYEAIHRITGGIPPKVDFEYENRLRSAYLKALELDLIGSAIDCSHGGLGCALAEMCISSGRGVVVHLDSTPNSCSRYDELLFSESHGRFLLGVSEGNVRSLLGVFGSSGIPCSDIGRFSDGDVTVRGGGGVLVKAKVDELKESYESSIRKLMGD